MKPPQLEVFIRLVRFLDVDAYGLRRFVLNWIVETREFTADSLYEIVSQRFEVSKKSIASLIGYISSHLGLLHVNKRSYRSPKRYMLKEEYVDLAKSVLKPS
jgi:hypothetical protein